MSNVIQSVRFADNPNNQKYADVLIGVQQAICEGNDAEAGRLCDESIDLAESLSFAVVRWMQSLSSDLESFCDEELLQENNYSPDAYWELVGQACFVIENDPEQLLRLLRFKQNILTPDKIAYFRGRAYGLLGFPNVGIAFTRLASELAPQQPAYRIALINLLKEQEHSDELGEELNRLLSDPATSPKLIIFAVTISYSKFYKTAKGESRSYLGEMKQKLEYVFNYHPLETFDHNTALMGLHTLGVLQDRLNRPAKAQKIYLRALQLAPDNQHLRMSLAMSLIRTNSIEANRIFRQIAMEGTQFEAAYLFAAKAAAESGSFVEAAMMAEKVLAITGETRLRALAYEMLAIIESELNGVSDKAEQYFSEALRLAPDDANIQYNYEIFQDEANKGESQQSAQGQPLQKHSLNEWLELNSIFNEAELRNINRNFFEEEVTQLSVPFHEAMKPWSVALAA